MKTSIIQAARSHEFNRDVNSIGSLINRNTIASFKAGAKFAQRWIPIEEELPEIKDKSYQILVKLIPTPQGTVLYRIFTVFNYTSESRLKIELRHYTHWRPIEYE